MRKLRLKEATREKPKMSSVPRLENDLAGLVVI